MFESERKFFGDKEPFDFYLSAFLSAARSVHFRLLHEQEPIYKTWQADWEARLLSKDRALYKFLIDDRNAEVHDSGSCRRIIHEEVRPGGGTHMIDGGTLTIFEPIGVTPSATYRQGYRFTNSDFDLAATDACRIYLSLLEGMVAQFEHDNKL